MLGLDAVHLGNLICSSRKHSELTQKELAKQTGLAVKTIQDIEKGRKYPSYETLIRLVARLGIPPDVVLIPKKSISVSNEQRFLEMLHSCDPGIQDILLKIMHLLIEELHALRNRSD